jgi:hypothetical protein
VADLAFLDSLAAAQHPVARTLGQVCQAQGDPLLAALDSLAAGQPVVASGSQAVDQPVDVAQANRPAGQTRERGQRWVETTRHRAEEPLAVVVLPVGLGPVGYFQVRCPYLALEGYSDLPCEGSSFFRLLNVLCTGMLVVSMIQHMGQLR